MISYITPYIYIYKNRLSTASYAARDPQSDRCCWHRLHPIHLKDVTWEADGCRLMMFLGSVMSSAVLARLPPPETFGNASFAYFLMLLHFSENHRRHGQQWETFSLPHQTMRNLVQMLAQTMTACIVHDATSPCDLAARQEQLCEAHFSKVKALFAGSPGVHDGFRFQVSCPFDSQP